MARVLWLLDPFCAKCQCKAGVAPLCFGAFAWEKRLLEDLRKIPMERRLCKPCAMEAQFRLGSYVTLYFRPIQGVLFVQSCQLCVPWGQMLGLACSGHEQLVFWLLGSLRNRRGQPSLKSPRLPAEL